jgi:pimeloyl-ACP methyl ester carboxylesterase
VTALYIVRGAILLGLVLSLGCQAQVPNSNPPVAPGKLVDIGGRKLHLYCTGRGSPTVVLEAGAGEFSTDWALVQPAIAKDARVCSYDRAGYGWSDPAPEWDSPEQVSNDLKSALSKAGERPPYVLVGHSMGGLFVRWYQHEHPNEVVGMVLIETYETTAPVNGKQVPIYTLTKEQLQANLPPPSSLKKPPLPTEVHPPFDKLPADAQKYHLWLERHFFETVDFNKGPQMMESWRSAFSVLHDASLKPDSLHGLPLAVITREDVSEDERQQQRHFSHLSSRSTWEIAVGSGHFVDIERPDIVIGAVERVMHSAGNNTGARNNEGARQLPLICPILPLFTRQPTGTSLNDALILRGVDTDCDRSKKKAEAIASAFRGTLIVA